MHRRLAAIALVLVSLVPTAAVHAAPARDLDVAAQHWQDLDFDLVIAAADAVLAAPAATRAQRVEALRFKGSALVVLERADEAQAVFAALFEIAPDYELADGTPPRIVEAFQAAHAAWQARRQAELDARFGAAIRQITLEVAPPRNATGGLPVSIELTLRDPGRLVKDLVLAYRRRGTSSYSTLVVPARAGKLTATVPASLTASDRPYVLEAHLRARHESGAVLRRVGAADRPFSISVSAGRVPRSSGLTERWWFWPGVATLAASVVAIPFLVDRARDVGPQDVVIRR